MCLEAASFPVASAPLMVSSVIALASADMSTGVPLEICTHVTSLAGPRPRSRHGPRRVDHCCPLENHLRERSPMARRLHRRTRTPARAPALLHLPHPTLEPSASVGLTPCCVLSLPRGIMATATHRVAPSPTWVGRGSSGQCSLGAVFITVEAVFTAWRRRRWRPLCPRGTEIASRRAHPRESSGIGKRSSRHTSASP